MDYLLGAIMGAGWGDFKREVRRCERIGGEKEGESASVKLCVLRGFGGIADAVLAGGFGLVHG
ncbi:MAG: hypothetical protein ACJ74T_20255, partial [Pyrinomonadaceae bacterium]